MSWVKKDRTVSADKVVKNTFTTENLGCVKDEYDMASNSPIDVPTQSSVVDFVKTYATAPVIEGVQENPSDAYLASLIKANDLKIREGDSLLYLYNPYGGKVLDSRSIRYSDDRGITVTVRQPTKIDVSNDIQNYLRPPNTELNPDSQSLDTFLRPDVGGTSGFTIPSSKDQLIVDASSGDRFYGWNAVGLEVGETYEIIGNVTATTGVGVDAVLYEPGGIINFDEQQLIGQTTGAFNVPFVAERTSHLFGFSGINNSNLTIEDWIVRKTQTLHTVTTTVKANAQEATYKYTILESGKRDVDFATLAVTINNVTLNSGQTTNYLDHPLVFKFSRSAVGTSVRKVLVEVKMQDQFLISGDYVTVTKTVEEVITLSVTV